MPEVLGSIPSPREGDTLSAFNVEVRGIKDGCLPLPLGLNCLPVANPSPSTDKQSELKESAAPSTPSSQGSPTFHPNPSSALHRYSALIKKVYEARGTIGNKVLT